MRTVKRVVGILLSIMLVMPSSIVPVATSATASATSVVEGNTGIEAWVQKLSGNQNILNIVIADNSGETGKSFIIANNAAGVYAVSTDAGDYQVYVDTKSGGLVRDLYMISFAPAKRESVSVETSDQLQAAVDNYATAVDDVIAVVEGELSLDAGFVVPVNPYGAAFVIKSSNPENPAVIKRGEGPENNNVEKASVFAVRAFSAAGDPFADSMIKVNDGAALVLEDVVLDGNKADFPDNEAPLVYVGGGAFKMNAGAVLTNNSGKYEGGGVYVGSGGEFTMTGGEISGNGGESSFGGGVYVSDGGEFTMTGGEISGNTGIIGGGVLVEGGTFVLGGDAVIRNNAISNVYLADSSYIAFSESVPPVSDMSIGIQTDDAYGVIVGSGAVPGDEQYFLPDDDNGIVSLINDNQLAIISRSGGGASGGGTFSSVEPLTITVSGFEELKNATDAYENAANDVEIVIEWGLLVEDVLSVANGNGATLTIKGAAPGSTSLLRSNNGSVFSVGSGANLVLDGVVIDGRTEWLNPYPYDHSPLVRVHSGGSFTMKNGAWVHHNNGGGVEVDCAGSIFKMEDGIIANNYTSGNGGGVLVNGGTFIMTGGTIVNNTAADNGGGVYISGCVDAAGDLHTGKFILENGEIGVSAAGANTAGNGGGVYVDMSGEFTMTGGEIFGNTAAENGAGVYVLADKFVLGGTAAITDNNSFSYDSGLYDTDNNVYLNGGYIALGSALNMMIGVQTTRQDGIIVASGASPGDEEHFYAVGRTVRHVGGQLVIETSADAVSVTPSPIRIKSLEAGYSSEDASGAARTARITNTGLDTITLMQPDVSDDFVIEGYYKDDELITSLPVALGSGEIAEFKVSPAAGLPAGAYSEEIMISWESAENAGVVNNTPVTVSFNVQQQSGRTEDADDFNELESLIINEYSGASDNLTIEITNSFDITQALNITNSNGAIVVIKSKDPSNPVTLTRGSGFHDNLFAVQDANLILEDIIVDGNRGDCRLSNRDYCPDADPDSDVTMGSLVYVENGHLTMRDGVTLQNNGGFYLSGGAVSVADGTFEMEGGKIIDNTAFAGGGVYLSYDSEFKMSGGEIGGETEDFIDDVSYGPRSAGNEAMFGGGVMIDSFFDGFETGNSYIAGGAFNMTGGNITGNAAEWWGSGSGLGNGVYLIYNAGTFINNGGTIVDHVCADDNGTCVQP